MPYTFLSFSCLSLPPTLPLSLSPVVPKHDFCLSEILMSILKTWEIRGTEPWIRKDLRDHAVPHVNVTNSHPFRNDTCNFPAMGLCMLIASEVTLFVLHLLVSGMPWNIRQKRIFLKWAIPSPQIILSSRYMALAFSLSYSQYGFLCPHHCALTSLNLLQFVHLQLSNDFNWQHSTGWFPTCRALLSYYCGPVAPLAPLEDPALQGHCNSSDPSQQTHRRSGLVALMIQQWASLTAKTILDSVTQS